MKIWGRVQGNFGQKKNVFRGNIGLRNIFYTPDQTKTKEITIF